MNSLKYYQIEKLSKNIAFFLKLIKKQNIEFNYPLWIEKWDDQEDRDRLFGYLFFPIQLEEPNEPEVFLYSNLKLYILLKISSSYHNLLSRYHITAILEQYEENVVSNLKKLFNIDSVTEKYDQLKRKEKFYSLGILGLYLLDTDYLSILNECINDERSKIFLAKGNKEIEEIHTPHSIYRQIELENDLEKNPTS